ncbi:MAG: hypothetical protein J6J35_05610 [Alphaproteobacteria bacterium]|nr:hypothetical protein [Alphaproteobacteria bacterium]
MEKNYVKDTYKALAFFVSVGVLYLAVWVYSQVISEHLYHPFAVNVGYVLAGGVVGMLLGCFYGWLYLKEKTLTILAIASLLTIGLYLAHGLYMIKPLTDNAYPLGLFFLILVFAIVSFIFRSAIKEGRAYDQLLQKIAKSNEEFRKDFENRLPDIIKESLAKLTKQRVIEHLKSSTEKPNPPLS